MTLPVFTVICCYVIWKILNKTWSNWKHSPLVSFRVIYVLRVLLLCGCFQVIVNFFPWPHRNVEPPSGVDQVTAEQSSFLNASIYPWGPPPPTHPSVKPSLCLSLWRYTVGRLDNLGSTRHAVHCQVGQTYSRLPPEIHTMVLCSHRSCL